MIKGGLRPKGIKKKSLKASRKKKNPYTVKALDKVFSSFIRQSRANKEGVVGCYTCPFAAHYKKMHAGHYISRFFKATRWNEMNVKPQCFMCNIHRKGNAVIFRKNLIQDYSVQEVEEMEKHANYLARGFASPEQLQPQIEHYKHLLATLTT